MLNGKINGMDNRGVFQFESSGISGLLKAINVDSFEDMIVANALYRPGPLGAKMHLLYADYKHGRKPIDPLHPKMKDILKDTYSIMVYQENVMKISQELAGFTRGMSDTLRKAVGKKNPELLEKQKNLFIDGCEKNGIIRETATKIFEQIEYFGGYGFNKSHSCAYAFLAYQCCYLKVYYPIEFMTALLSSEIDNSDQNLKLKSYIAQAQSMGITVGNTSVDRSGNKFRIEKRVRNGKEESFIRSPLTMLAGVGLKAAESIIENQPYTNLEDFLKRVDTSKVSSKVFSELVSAGSMDSWNKDSKVSKDEHRSSLLNSYEGVKKKVVKEKNDVKKQTEFQEQYSGSIFDSFGTVTI
jgi:DNA polymerase-3 subunit alpha